VDVAAQHEAYFPFAAEIRRKLDEQTRDTAARYDMVRCGACGLHYVSPMKAPNSRWYELAYRALNVVPEQRWEFDVVLGELDASDTVYEIGCGFGGFLERCQARGIRAFGIDFSPEAVRRCLERNLNAAAVDVGLTSHSPGPTNSSVVLSFHVLEHLERPDDLFRRACEVAASDSTLWVSVPSSRRPARLLDMVDPLDDPPHHLTKWTEHAFASVGQPHGWVLERVFYEPFSWRGALWIIASNSAAYRTLAARGLFASTLLERTTRLILYPWALLRLILDPRRKDMTGFAMMAKYRRARIATQKLPA
jgi:SAM-dependent methyltransferase